MNKILIILISSLFSYFSVFANDLKITVIDDKRCGQECPIEAVLDQLKELPSISDSEIIIKDFSDKGIYEYLKNNNIGSLPVFIFSTNDFDISNDLVQYDAYGNTIPTVREFLKLLPEGEYFLPVGAIFNPFTVRSTRGFLILDKNKNYKIKSNSFIKGNDNAQITILIYSDIECPYCARLHNNGTLEELIEKYGNRINIIFNHFPLGFHSNAQIGAEILECVADEKGKDVFYKLLNKSYKEGDSSKDFLIKEAIILGSNKEKLNNCIDEGRFIEKVKSQMSIGTEIFGITGTPGNVIINNRTGEYEILSGAYPTKSFEKIIDKLLLPKEKNYTKQYILSKSNLNKSYNGRKYINQFTGLIEKLDINSLNNILKRVLLAKSKINLNNNKYADLFNFLESLINLELKKR